MDSGKKRQIDLHLERICFLQATLGIDSTVKERAEVKRKQREHELLIKKIDKDYYLRVTVDSNER